MGLGLITAGYTDNLFSSYKPIKESKSIIYSMIIISCRPGCSHLTHKICGVIV